MKRTPAAILLLALVTTLGFGSGGASAATGPLQTGLVDLQAYSEGNQLAYDRTRDAGASFVRLNVDWRSVALREPTFLLSDPTNPADRMYEWGPLDREVKLAVGAGLEPILQLYGAPKWAERCKLPKPDQPCDPDPGRFAQFALAAARRYSGTFRGLPRVRYWQAWNEPNLRFFFNPQPGVDQLVVATLYRDLLNGFSSAVKSVDPSNLVLAAGLAPIARPDATIGPLAFMRAMLCMDGRETPVPSCDAVSHFDIWAVNPYTTGGPTHHAAGPDDVSIGDLPELRRLVRAAERAGHIQSDIAPTPIWATEFSWDSKPPDPGGLPSWLHARWTSEALYRMWKAGVSMVSWFQLRDEASANPLDGLLHQSGLYYRGATLAEDKPKRTLQAFRFPFVALKSKKVVRLWGRTPTSQGGRVLIEGHKAGKWRRVAVLKADGYGIFNGRLKRKLSYRSLRARYGVRHSIPFALRHVPDRYVKPFGSE